MKTVVKSGKVEVTIGAEMPFVIIGEKINPTGNKKLSAALKEGNYSFICDLAREQVAAGADILDVNVGIPGLNEAVVLPEVARILSETVEVPICLDSVDPEALEAALTVLPGRPLVNSVNGEEKCLAAVLPIIKEYQVPVIGLVLDEHGVSKDAETRTSIARKIIERAAEFGIPAEDILIDPLVLAAGSEEGAGAITLETIQTVSQTFGANIILGASNISFGLPDRHTLNQAFLAMAIGQGATCAITDPVQMAPIIRASDLLAGRDPFARRYITYWRTHKSKE